MKFHQVYSPLENFLWLENSADGTPVEKILPTPMHLLHFWVRYGVKARLACTVAEAADIQWSKMLTVCNAARVKLGCSLTSTVL